MMVLENEEAGEDGVCSGREEWSATVTVAAAIAVVIVAVTGATTLHMPSHWPPCSCVSALC